MFEDQKKTPQPAPVGPPAGLEIPKGAAKPPSPGPSIHVMPKEYYGIAPKTPVKKISTPPVPKPLPPPPPPKPEKLSTPPVSAKKRRIPVVLMIGVLFVAVLAIGGYLFLRSIRQLTPSQVVETPTPEPEPTPQPEPQPPPPTTEPIRPGIDTDSDGLTDVEERTIYGSDPRNPDTDGDSFIDGNEVFHLYDPTHGQDAQLEKNSRITRWFSDIPPGYHFLVPVSWQPQPSGDPSFGAMVAPSDERFELTIYMPNEEQTPASRFDSFASWVQLGADRGGSMHPAGGGRAFTTKQGLSAWRSEDNTTVYLDRSADDRVYELHYNLGEVKRTIDFLRTFEAAVNSFTYD